MADNPLKFIFTTRTRASPRIERWQMKLQSYQFNIMYKQGSDNIVDFMSRIRNNSMTVESDETREHTNLSSRTLYHIQ